MKITHKNKLVAEPEVITWESLPCGTCFCLIDNKEGSVAIRTSEGYVFLDGGQHWGHDGSRSSDRPVTVLEVELTVWEA